jgi:hypothetical protein
MNRTNLMGLSGSSMFEHMPGGTVTTSGYRLLCGVLVILHSGMPHDPGAFSPPRAICHNGPWLQDLAINTDHRCRSVCTTV